MFRRGGPLGKLCNFLTSFDPSSLNPKFLAIFDGIGFSATKRVFSTEGAILVFRATPPPPPPSLALNTTAANSFRCFS